MNEEKSKIENTEDENKNEKSKWGGKRDGAGRKEGSQNSNTVEDNIVKAEFRQRVLRSMDVLINSQMNLAQGCQLLFKIKKGKKGEETKPELVTRQSEIEDYLAGEYDNEDGVYYFITTKVPDNKAIDSLIDRVFGKAPQTVDLTTKGKRIGIFDYVQNKQDEQDKQNKENEDENRTNNSDQPIKENEKKD